MTKYVKGEPISNVDELLEIGDEGLVFWKGKPRLMSFVTGKPLRTILMAIHTGRIQRAIYQTGLNYVKGERIVNIKQLLDIKDDDCVFWEDNLVAMALVENMNVWVVLDGIIGKVMYRAIKQDDTEHPEKEARQ